MDNCFNIKFEKEILKFEDIRHINYNIQDYLLENFNRIKIDNHALESCNMNKKEFSEYGFLYEYWNGMNY